MKFNYSIFLLLFLSSCVPPPPESEWPALEPINKIRLTIPEPSDICLSPGQQSFYIVSDRGALFETDLEGKILQRANFPGSDLEGVWYQPPYIHIVDERLMRITLLDPSNLKTITSHSYDIPIKANKGWESITYNTLRKTFVLFTEKKPVKLFEIDKNYLITREEETKVFKDVSACTWYNNKLWVLSDEKREFYRVDPNTYEIETGWSIPVVNPEGICFSKDGKIYILSDRRGGMYVFELPKN